MKKTGTAIRPREDSTHKPRQSRLTLLAMLLTFLCFPLFSWAEWMLVPAAEMQGIEHWKENQSWGAGNYYSSNGSPLTKRLLFEGGEYAVYARIFTSPWTEADIHVLVNGKRLVPPMQAKVHKLGWIRLGSVFLPDGTSEIQVESPTPGTASNHNLAALAFCSTPLDDRVARIIAFTDWLRHELIRLEAPKPAPRSVQQARAQQQRLRRHLLETLGLDPLPPRTPLKAQIRGQIEKDDYVIEKIAYESRPNHLVPALLYKPMNATSPVPAVISAIGHWSYGKSSKAPQLRGIGLAKRGYAVLALDPVYAWERSIPGNSEGFEPFVSGGCIAGHEVWDIMRAADYLETRPDIDATRLAVTGASGGGLQAFYAGAVDERFDAVMPAVALWSMPELALNFYYSGDNWVPGISRLGGMGSLIALIAPRAALIMNVDADYSTSYACEVMVNASRPYYQRMGVENKLLHTIEKGPHNYTQRMRETTYAFVDRWLKGIGDGFPVEEDDFQEELLGEEDSALFVFAGGKIPTEGAETVASFWTAQAAAHRDSLPDQPEGLPDKIRQLLNLPPPYPSDAIREEEGFLLTTDPGVQVAVRRLGSGEPAVVWLGESDLDTESERPEVQKLAERATVFVVEPRGAGMNNEMHILRHAPIVMGRPLCGMWAYDLLCTVDHIARTQEFAAIHVAGRGWEMGPACLLATLLDDRIKATAIDRTFSSFVQLVGYNNPAPQIPGILRVADVEHLVRAAGQQRIYLNQLQKSKWSHSIQATQKPSVQFFVDWLQEVSN